MATNSALKNSFDDILSGIGGQFVPFLEGFRIKSGFATAEERAKMLLSETEAIGKLNGSGPNDIVGARNAPYDLQSFLTGRTLANSTPFSGNSTNWLLIGLAFVVVLFVAFKR
jgi:hypothetical protein